MDIKTNKIPYLNWRERIEDITPPDHRIGEEILLIERNAEYRNDINEPFKTDATFSIIYTKGWARMKIDMQEHIAEAPCVMTIMYDQIFQPLEHSDDVESKVIVMSKAFSNGMFFTAVETHRIKSSIYRNPIMKISGSRGEEVFEMYYRLLLNLTVASQKEFKLEAARHLTLSMFYGYSSGLHGNTPIEKKYSRAEELYAEFIELLRTHHKKERELVFYSDRLCITSKYLSQLVKEITGRTALDCIEEYVVAESKALLRSTNMTIQQISDALNFSSQSVFGKYFKRVTGMSPKEYRAKS